MKIQLTSKLLKTVFTNDAIRIVGMSLNIDKYSINVFFQKNSVNKLFLTRKDTINDLEVLFDLKKSFNIHVDYIQNKSLMKIGLLKRMYINFYHESALKMKKVYI